MVFALSMMMVMTFALVMTLRSLSSCWLANLSKSFLDSRHIGLVRIISDSCCLSLQIKNNILHTTLEILVIRNILQNIINRIEAEEDKTLPEDYFKDIIIKLQQLIIATISVE